MGKKRPRIRRILLKQTQKWLYELRVGFKNKLFLRRNFQGWAAKRKRYVKKIAKRQAQLKTRQLIDAPRPPCSRKN